MRLSGRRYMRERRVREVEDAREDVRDTETVGHLSDGHCLHARTARLVQCCGCGRLNTLAGWLEGRYGKRCVGSTGEAA